MNDLNFTFSDLISGYITSYDKAAKSIGIKTSDGRDYEGKLTDNTYAKQTQNLGEGWQDRTSELDKLLTPGQMVFTYGTFFPENKVKFEIRTTYHSKLISIEELDEMISFLNEKQYIGNYYIQNFRNASKTISKLQYSMPLTKEKIANNATINVVIR